ncbi:hypothetical protein JYU29_12330 [Tianweitania sp. BSSL-BM11]|uniref:Uncharacterized protein n=1 Tax=Tianweitania aestuarii TaxID=2814886 RepID=A0ABS5RYT3_9HYPH|nr:hypothetical protein [Tianweitania aestuarii]MBS9721472.1 hypothetical protein [Tianweitania aestuarii]
MSMTRKPYGQPGEAGWTLPPSADDGKVILLSDVRNTRQRRDAVPLPVQRPVDHAQEKRTGSEFIGSPDLAAIARHPSYTERRRRLAEAMTSIHGQQPTERLLDHQMIATGLAAGHGATLDGPVGERVWPLGNPYADPAVVVGLVLHHVRHTASRGLPIPAGFLTALDEHVACGNAAARLVRDWLTARDVSCEHSQLRMHRGEET